jgi:hypothetical protein
MNPALYQLLERYYRSKRNGLLILVAICSVVALVGIGWGVADLIDDPTVSKCPPRMRSRASCVAKVEREAWARTGVLVGIPGLMILVGGIALLPLVNLSKAPIIRTFTSRRDEVAWVYPKRTSVRRYGVEVSQIHEIVVCTLDGKRETLTMNEDDVQATLRFMALEAPRAATGWSDQLDMQFRMNPRGVMKAVGATLVSALRDTPVRIAVAPSCPFSQLDTAVRYLGYAAEGAPSPSPVPGEPGQAAWSGKGTRITYSFDPSVYLRLLEVHGGDAGQLRNELGGVVAVPLLAPPQIAGMLGAPDPRSVLLGVLAAEATFEEEDRHAHRPAVERLKAHPDEAVARAAQRIFRAWS